jgi:hypothetical protein
MLRESAARDVRESKPAHRPERIAIAFADAAK